MMVSVTVKDKKKEEPKGATYGTGQPKKRFYINQAGPFTREEYEKKKRDPGFVQSTYRAPGNIGQIATGQKTPEQAQIIEKEARAGKESLLQPAEQLSSELGGKIADQPDLTPSPILEETAGMGLAPGVWAGNLILAGLEKITGKQYGRETTEDLQKTLFGKYLGNATLGVAAAASILYASPYVAKLFASGTAKTAMTAKLGILGKASGLVATYFGTKQVLDYKGGELETMRGIISSFTEDGERLQALALQGGDPVTILAILQEMSDEVDYAESVIKDIGNKNIQFRYEKEYIKDMQKIRSARLALQRRTDAVTNIALQGGTSIDPEGLMYIASLIGD